MSRTVQWRGLRGGEFYYRPQLLSLCISLSLSFFSPPHFGSKVIEALRKTPSEGMNVNDAAEQLEENGWRRGEERGTASRPAN